MGVLLIPLSFFLLIIYALIERIKAQSSLHKTISKFNSNMEAIKNIEVSNFKIGNGHIY